MHNASVSKVEHVGNFLISGLAKGRFIDSCAKKLGHPPSEKAGL